MTTTFFLNCVMGNVFSTQTTPSLPNTYYIGLSTTAPSADGSGVNEPSGGSYARVALTTLSVPEDGVVSNLQDIEFPESTEDWGTVTHFVLYDAANGGHLLMGDALAKPRTIQSENQLRFKAGTLKFSLRESA